MPRPSSAGSLNAAAMRMRCFCVAVRQNNDVAYIIATCKSQQTSDAGTLLPGLGMRVRRLADNGSRAPMRQGEHYTDLRCAQPPQQSAAVHVFHLAHSSTVVHHTQAQCCSACGHHRHDNANYLYQLAT